MEPERLKAFRSPMEGDLPLTSAERPTLESMQTENRVLLSPVLILSRLLYAGEGVHEAQAI